MNFTELLLTFRNSTTINFLKNAFGSAIETQMYEIHPTDAQYLKCHADFRLIYCASPKLSSMLLFPRAKLTTFPKFERKEESAVASLCSES